MSIEPESLDSKILPPFRFSIFNLLCLIVAASFCVFTVVREIEHHKQVQSLEQQIQELEFQADVQKLEFFDRGLRNEISETLKEAKSGR